MSRFSSTTRTTLEEDAKTTSVFFTAMSALSKDLTKSVVEAHEKMDRKHEGVIADLQAALKTANDEKAQLLDKFIEAKKEAAESTATASGLKIALEEVRRQNKIPWRARPVARGSGCVVDGRGFTSRSPRPGW